MPSSTPLEDSAPITSHCATPWGLLRMERIGQHLLSASFDRPYSATSEQMPQPQLQDALCLNWLNTWLSNARADISLTPPGTPFQHAVWQALRAIPPGETRSYGDIARLLGRPSASRAVGQAIAANPLALFIPCHRVVPQQHPPGHYRWGSQRKAALLNWEQGMHRMYAL